ncbi:glutamine--fructose-6-phosphate transaminase (isomerizing) [Ignatzschineria rhizosphaerae]|uniref:Glutamine--fructose-6-phosphate aminotransferase [isomerizing] n=1 Tax=Ignatzschineria rhizosphaerae TaxID=2923279 RepID=A0ABY3X384_9GAMM|nr:glutamine--fructose-6-phosphate transaminase (isomerizing) [Ignatzschineria rhizosphaerae]UNM97343.1 glutamine--fructose-6-phosphate transaminase (isomerizing) [Ignatzschineria rhizosphaerae]
MCGIFGAISHNHNILPTLLNGLEQLEYRGYDSAGIAFLTDHHLERIRAIGRVENLKESAANYQSHIAIGHTRWATHGGVSVENAHPHRSEHLMIVHNGIIDAYEEHKKRLTLEGYQFTSETDTEVLVHLLHEAMQSTHDLLLAVKKVVQSVTGNYVLLVMNQNDSESLIATMQGCPLILGLKEDTTFIASDIAAIIPETNRLIYLEQGDCVVMKAGNIAYFSNQAEQILTSQEIAGKIQISDLSTEKLDIGHYEHFMLKEIFEQPHVIEKTALKALEQEFAPSLFGDKAPAIFPEVKRIQILACGTSYFAGIVAKYWLETIAKIPTIVEISSEYRYREVIIEAGTMIVTISQSGETLDTIEAKKHAFENGAFASLAICNVKESVLPRTSDCRFYTEAGIEVGVASTKAFTTQLTALFILANALAKSQAKLTEKLLQTNLQRLHELPAMIAQSFNCQETASQWGALLQSAKSALYLGRGIHFPIAAEGALKLKEISYIHAESYPAGELKHGPLALVDDHMPIIALLPHDALFEKVRANLHEVLARKGKLFIITDSKVPLDDLKGAHIMHVPEVSDALSPILLTIPVQLVAYYAALVRGEDIDKPRNLAKSLTVE